MTVKKWREINSEIHYLYKIEYFLFERRHILFRGVLEHLISSYIKSAYHGFLYLFYQMMNME